MDKRIVENRREEDSRWEKESLRLSDVATGSRYLARLSLVSHENNTEII